MARSKSGSKSPGFEFWSKRPMTFWSSTWAKRYTHRIERQQGKILTRKETVDNM